jgi:hypothetical protein
VPMLGWKVYRAQCWPFVKLYCRREHASAATVPPDVHLENKMLGALKIINLGIPFLIYGLAAPMWFHSLIRIPHRDLTNKADDIAAVGTARAALAASASGTREYHERKNSSLILSARAPPVADAVDLIFLYDVGEYERGFAATKPGAKPSE